ncbi:MAG TPA: SCO2322 family protein [Nocardioidaceae bacterium]|nr:SCO2322 family protein [Nocardioidaceae bacterium]
MLHLPASRVRRSGGFETASANAPASSTTSPGSSTTRAIGATLVAALMSLLLAPLLAAPAHAADGYRYWNYFHVQHGDYVFAKTGPGGFTPADGSVEAYRYGTSTTSAGIEPRADLSHYTFARVCSGTDPAPGTKRVAVLLDYGTAADAASGQAPPSPRAACAQVPEAANGQQVLGDVAQVRTAKSLTCGIDGYPVNGCSTTVKNAEAPGSQRDVAFALSDSSEPGGTPVAAIVAVVVVIVLIGAGALVVGRRNARNAEPRRPADEHAGA